MLQLLHIDNIAIIEHAEIQFDGGFNVLTGETGAGKSIVIDSINAVLGQRTSRDLIRTGAEKAFVSAIFSNVGDDFFRETGLEKSEDLLLQREIFSDGRNICKVNDRPITVTQLRTYGDKLLNIHGQHDGQQLLDETQHEKILDSYGKTNPELEAYAESFGQFQKIKREIHTLEMDASEKARRVDTLRYQIQELERAHLKAGEEDELTARSKLLRNGEKYIAAISEADFCLNGDDSQNGALSLLRQAKDAVNSLKNIDSSYEELCDRISDLYSDLYDISDTVSEKKDAFEFSPNELDEVEGRLDQLYRLKKKYGPSVEDMIDYLENCKQELDKIETSDDRLIQLEKDLKKKEKETRGLADALSEKRKSASKVLENRIQEELRQLDMPKVRFSVSFDTKELDESGYDDIRFLMSANTGEDLKPINKIASGGELARIMLAIKNVLSDQDKIATLVFDEVDTGVSGRAAQKVAEKMACISRKKQILCVTHLSQIAAMADHHFSVEKGEHDGRTFTSVKVLSHDERKLELSRLTGGSHISEALLSSAEELLREAENFKNNLK